jgi:hypothetical protein
MLGMCLITLSSFRFGPFFPFLIIALLEYNSHTIKFTCLKVYNSGVLINSQNYEDYTV